MWRHKYRNCRWEFAVICECCIVSCCNGSLLKPQRRVVITTVQPTFFCAFPSSLSLLSSSCSLPFLSPSHFSSPECGVKCLLPHPEGCHAGEEHINTSSTSKKTSKTWMSSVFLFENSAQNLSNDLYFSTNKWVGFWHISIGYWQCYK